MKIKSREDQERMQSYWYLGDFDAWETMLGETDRPLVPPGGVP
jgi:hypothetical protein